MQAAFLKAVRRCCIDPSMVFVFKTRRIASQENDDMALLQALNDIRTQIDTKLTSSHSRAKREILTEIKVPAQNPEKTVFALNEINEMTFVNSYAPLDIIIRLQNSHDERFVLFVGEFVSVDLASYKGRVHAFLDGKIVQQIDFNHGRSSDDMNFFNTSFNRSASIAYTSDKKVGKQTILKFDDVQDKSLPGGHYLSSFTDMDGIDGNGPARIDASHNNSNLVWEINRAPMIEDVAL